MFLATILSFLVNRKFQGKKYVAIMITITVLTSFFSVFGWIEVTQRTTYTGTYCYIRPILPLPLSFPFFTYVYLFDSTRDSSPVEVYDLFFLGGRINREYTHWFPASRGFIYYSFFLLVNIVGSVIGYRLSKMDFAEPVLRKRRESPEEHKDQLSLHRG